MKKLIEKAAAFTACLIAVIAITSVLAAVVSLASGFGGF